MEGRTMLFVEFFEKIKELGNSHKWSKGGFTVFGSLETDEILYIPSNIAFRSEVLSLPNLRYMPVKTKMHCETIILENLEVIHSNSTLYASGEIYLPNVIEINKSVDLWTDGVLYLNKGVKVPKNTLFILNEEVVAPERYKERDALTIRARELVMV